MWASRATDLRSLANVPREQGINWQNARHIGGQTLQMSTRPYARTHAHTPTHTPVAALEVHDSVAHAAELVAADAALVCLQRLLRDPRRRVVLRARARVRACVCVCVYSQSTHSKRPR